MSTDELEFSACVAELSPDGSYGVSLRSRSVADLAPGNVVIRAEYSGLNYKDQLVAAGYPGVARGYPQIPGIDVAGTVVASTDPRFQRGNAVLVTGYGMGVHGPGGWARYVRVPGEWVVPRPVHLTARTAMIFGTPGLTAMLGRAALARAGMQPGSDVLITGATGAVGTMAVMLFAAAGYQVQAVSGRRVHGPALEALGAREVLARDTLTFTGQGLGHARFAAAFDTVGGQILASVLAQMRYGAPVAACGMIAGAELPATVYPFILRGITLLGIDSVAVPMALRRSLWSALAVVQIPEALETMLEEVTLEDLPAVLIKRRRGAPPGRLLIRL